MKRIEELLKEKHGKCDIPDEVIKEIARCLAPNIVAFFENEEAKREWVDPNGVAKKETGTH